jgi:RNA recognition motif-containing protein
VEYAERPHAEAAIQKFNGQPFNGRPLAVSEARAREDRGPGGPRPGGGFGGPPRPGGFSGPPRPGGGGFGGPRFDPAGPPPPRGSRNFGPDAKPQRGGSAKSKKKDQDKPRGPIPMKNTGRSFSLDDVDAPDEPLPDIDDVATSKPHDDKEDEE